MRVLICTDDEFEHLQSLARYRGHSDTWRAFGELLAPMFEERRASMTLDEVERLTILDAVERHGNVAAAARALGTSRSNLYRKFAIYRSEGRFTLKGEENRRRGLKSDE